MSVSNVYTVIMSNEGNSVNIKGGSYHHGDLRAALMAEGFRLLAKRNTEAFSLREVARGVGVSATSVYRHFPDKDALLIDLAKEGLSQLAAVQRSASEAAGGGDAGFAATGRAYVRFALANPALFRLIFTSPALSASESAGEGMSEATILLQANAARAAEHGGGDTGVRAVQAWALVHGLAMLMLDGKLPPDLAMIDQVVV